jgi:hypothetical protein
MLAAEAMKHISAIFAAKGDMERSGSALSNYLNLINPSHVQGLQDSMRRAEQTMAEFKGQQFVVTPTAEAAETLQTEQRHGGFKKF